MRDHSANGFQKKLVGYLFYLSLVRELKGAQGCLSISLITKLWVLVEKGDRLQKSHADIPHRRYVTGEESEITLRPELVGSLLSFNL